MRDLAESSPGEFPGVPATLAIGLAVIMLVLLALSMTEHKKYRETESAADRLAWTIRRIRRDTGEWPSDFEDVLHSARSSCPPNTGQRNTDGWGRPFSYVPMDTERGYGLIRSDGGKGLVHAVLFLPRVYEWRFTWPRCETEAVSDPGRKPGESRPARKERP